MLLLALLACKGSDGEETGDTQPSGITYPSSQNVMIYTGNGGESGDSFGNGNTSFAQDWITQSYGFRVDEREGLGDPSTYRVVIMMDPGVRAGDTFSEEQIASLEDALAAGTRVVIQVNEANCAGEVVPALLTALGAPMTLLGTNVSNVSVVDAAAFPHQITEGVSDLYMVSPCQMETNGADPLLVDGRDVYGAAWRPGFGGELVLLGDYQWMDDVGTFDSGTNKDFLGNLVEVDPDFR